ncbi:MAG TPA: hypothetical protein VGH19_05500 [Verrucomicrobiae bacterium]
MNATLTELRNPKKLLEAADAGETVIITEHGKPAYELKRVPHGEVDWDELEKHKEDWLTEEEAQAIEKGIEASNKVFTHDRFP